MANPSITRNCLVCQAVFHPLPSRVRIGEGVVCSVECRVALQNQKIARECEWCRGVFHISPSGTLRGRGRFCSRVCGRMAARVNPTVDYLKSRCEVVGDCWEWRGFRDQRGYGQMGNRRRYPQATHRLAYELHHGIKLQSTDVVRHACDNPSCCNPAHLSVGTFADNSEDMVSRGRSLTGSKHPHAKLTEEKVLAIRKARREGATLTALGAAFGVNKTCIHAIVQGKAWRHVVSAPLTVPQPSAVVLDF